MNFGGLLKKSPKPFKTFFGYICKTRVKPVGGYHKIGNKKVPVMGTFLLVELILRRHRRHFGAVLFVLAAKKEDATQKAYK